MPSDILILGGGPAGLSAALHLAQFAPELKARILVLERGHYPRPKLCGGALLVDAEVLLRRLGLDVTEIAHVDAPRAYLAFAGKGRMVSYRDRHALRMIRRDEFDAWLARKTKESGIEVREGVTVKSVEPRPDSVVVETDAGRFVGMVVVGADGSNGVTVRCVRPDGTVHNGRTLEVFAPEIEVSASPVAPDLVHDKTVAYFDFFPVPQGIAGFTWDFPTQFRGQPMRCWGIYDANLSAARRKMSLRDALAAEMERHGYRLDDYELQGHPIRWFSAFSRFSVPRVVLAGDAAGVDGVLGEGISMSLAYGRLAAQSLRNAFAKNDFSFRDYHRRILMSPLGQALAVRTAFTHIIYRLHWPWFQELFWRILKPLAVVVASVSVLKWGDRMK